MRPASETRRQGAWKVNVQRVAILTVIDHGVIQVELVFLRFLSRILDEVFKFRRGALGILLVYSLNGREECVEILREMVTVPVVIVKGRSVMTIVVVMMVVTVMVIGATSLS